MPRRLPFLLVAPVVVLAACGGDDTTSVTTDDSAIDSSVDSAVDPTGDVPGSDEPQVDYPGEAPEELTVTVLVPGTGPEAGVGDTVVVDYVGVRSVDGVEFDSSYGTGRTFPVVLGQGSVIRGWDEGLVGVQAGGRYQLDIPSDLAYGDQAVSEEIPPDTALTFVVDVRAVYGPVDPADAPTDVELDPLGNVDELLVEDLVTGEGEPAAIGDTLVVNLIAYRADTGEQIDSTWESGQSIQLPLREGSPSLSGLVDGLEGMQVGGRRLLHIPYEQAFGTAGNEQLGLPAETDLIVVVDLVTTF
jgi:FKBP-type peptidyl-prolyl cis-trans isomerase